MSRRLDSLVKFDLFLKSKKGLGIIVLLILFYNTGLYNWSNQNRFLSEEVRRDAAGFSPDKAYKFSYFYFYTGDFPLATLNNDLEYSKEGAGKEISKRGEDLIMEYMHWSRLGENARIFAYLPNAYLSGSPKNPTIKLFNTIAFVFGLVLLFFGFWKIKKSMLGLIILILVNTTSFYLYEVYSHENIFGLMASVFFMILGLNVFILFNGSSNYLKISFTAIFSAALLGFFTEFRNEISVVLVSLLLIYVLSNSLKVITKIILVVTILFFFNSTKSYIRNYFNNKFEKTIQLVRLNGGHTYTGPKISGHNFWHPVFCGLGDFDEKYGYEWNDLKAYKYAIPILNKEYGMNIHYSGRYHTDDYYDEAKLYYKKPDEIANYEEVVKKKVFSDIKDDPLWFLKILFKRIFKTLTVTIPYSNIGLLIFPLLYYLYMRKKWNFIKLIIVSLPLSATSIIIYSGRGSTYNSVFVYFVLAIILSQLFEYFYKELNVKITEDKSLEK